MFSKKIKDRLNQLIERGEKVLSTVRTSKGERVFIVPHVDPIIFYKWRAGSLSFLEKVFGNDSSYFQEFKQNCKKELHLDAIKGQSILKAAKEDIESNYLED